MPETSAPRFNHVAFTVAPDLLGETGRKEIVSFYEMAFGWKEVESMRVDRRVDSACLVLQCHLPDQFVFIVGGSPITTCAPLDHFGLAVNSLQELEGIVRRAMEYSEKDDRVEVIGHEIEQHSGVRVHYAYVRYLLPMIPVPRDARSVARGSGNCWGEPAAILSLAAPRCPAPAWHRIAA